VPLLGPVFFTNQSILTYLGFLLVPAAWYWINRTRPGLHLRAVGESPTAADTLGVDVYRLRYAYVIAGGIFAGLGGATITLAISPGWFSELTTNGAGWIAIAIVIFARWNPVWAAVGAYSFGAIRRMIIDLQGPETLFGFPNPFFEDHTLTFFLEMLPYVLVIVVLIAVSGKAMRQRVGAPAALGIPYVRGERGA
jgi:simple sugar transport system permease protein